MAQSQKISFSFQIIVETHFGVKFKEEAKSLPHLWKQLVLPHNDARLPKIGYWEEEVAKEGEIAEKYCHLQNIYVNSRSMSFALKESAFFRFIE